MAEAHFGLFLYNYIVLGLDQLHLIKYIMCLGGLWQLRCKSYNLSISTLIPAWDVRCVPPLFCSVLQKKEKRKKKEFNY